LLESIKFILNLKIIKLYLTVVDNISHNPVYIDRNIGSESDSNSNMYLSPDSMQTDKYNPIYRQHIYKSLTSLPKIIPKFLIQNFCIHLMLYYILVVNVLYRLHRRDTKTSKDSFTISRTLSMCICQRLFNSSFL